MTEALITIDRASQSIAISGELEANKETVLTESALVCRVNDAETNKTAAIAQQNLSELRRLVEKAEEEAKKPLNKLRNSIIETCREFLAEVRGEEMRLAKLAGDFQALENAKRRAAEHAEQLEKERIERERRQEEARIIREQAEREAEEKRARETLAAKAKAEQAEADRKIREASNAAAKARAKREAAIQLEAQKAAALELERQQSLAAAQTHDQLEKTQEKFNDLAKETAAVPAPIRAEGQKVIEDWEIEVTDIWLLARAHPACVEIKPRLSEIKLLLKAGITPKGTRAEKVTLARTSGRKAIEV